MSTQVDTKIVELKFDQSDFAKKAEETMLKLEYLNRELDKIDASQVFSNLTKSARDVDMSNVGEAASEAANKFSTLEIVAITAIANISNSLVNLGKSMIKNLIDPIVKGGLTRAQNIELASFQFEGLGIEHSARDIKEQSVAYNEVMDAVLGTAYSYDVAAKAASQLAASNVGIAKSTKKLADGTVKETKVMTSGMTKAILGIAGVASMTGSDFESISEIFTRVAGQGRVMANDLNSIASRGLNAAAVLAKSKGKTESEIRDLVSKGKISFQDFSDAMSEAFGDHAKDSTKMFTGALEDVKAALSRIGADFYGPALTAGRDTLNSLTPLVDIFHEKIQWFLDDSGKGLLALSDKISKVLDTVSYATKSLEKVTKDSNPLDDWVKENAENLDNVIDLFINTTDIVNRGITGLGKGINGIKINGIKMLADYLGLTSDQVRSGIQNGTIGLKDFRLALEDLYNQSEKMNGDKTMWDALQNFLKALEDDATATDEFIDKLHTVQAIIGGFQSVISSVSSILKSLVNIIIEIAKPFTPLLTIVGKVIEALAQLTVGILEYIANSEKLKSVTETLTNIFSNFAKALHLDGITSALVNGITKAFDFIGNIIEKTFGGVVRIVESILKVIDSIITKLTELTGSVEFVQKAFKDLGIISLIALFAKIANSFAKPAEMLNDLGKYISNIGDIFTGVANSIKTLSTNIGKIFGSIGDAINALTNSIKADIVIKVAISIAILAGALYALSAVDGKKGANSLKLMAEEITLLVTEIGAVIIVLREIQRTFKGAKAIETAGKFLLEISASILILAYAAQKLASIKADRLSDSVGAITVLLAELGVLAAVLGGNETTKISWKGIEKNSKKMAKGIKNIIFLAGAVWILADACEKIADIPSDQIADCVGSIAFLLGEVAVIAGMLGRGDKTKGFLTASVSMVIMASAINIIAGALLKIAEIPQEIFTQTILTLGGIMLALTTVGVILGKVGSSFIGSAIAMVIMVEAFENIVDVLKAMNELDFETTIGSMIVLITTFGLLALAIGLLSSKALGSLLSAAGIAIVCNSLMTLAETLQVITDMGQTQAAYSLAVIGAALIGLATVITIFDGVSLIGLGKLVLSLLSIVGIAALFGVAAGVIGVGFSFLAAGIDALAGTASSMEGFVTVFLTVVGMIILATSLLSAFVLPILTVSAALVGFGLSLLSIGAGLQTVAVAINLLTGLKDLLPDTGKQLMDFTRKIAGMKIYSKDIGNAADDISKAITAMKDSVSKATDAFEAFQKTGSQIISNIIKGMNSQQDALGEALTKMCTKVSSNQNGNTKIFQNIGKQLIAGLIKGINDQQDKLEKAVQALEAKAERAIEAKAKIKSPSRVWDKIGRYLTLGLAKGIVNESSSVETASESLIDLSSGILSTAVDKLQSLMDSNFDIQPTITPVIDMSNATRSANAINTMFSSNRAFAVSASMNARVSQAEELNNTLAKFRDSIMSIGSTNNYYNVDGVTYDDGSNVANAVGQLISTVKMERRI